MIIIETTGRSNAISWTLYVLLGLQCLAVTTLTLIKLILEGLDTALLLLPVFVFQFMLGILCLRMILWFSRGKESVWVTNEQLILKKTGTFWIKKQKTFDWKDVKKITLQKNFYEENSPSELVHHFSRKMYIFRIQNTGRIKVVYNGFNTYRFLDNIGTDEAPYIIEKLQKARDIDANGPETTI